MCRCLEDDKDSGLGGFSKSDDDPFTIESTCFRFRDGDGEFFAFPWEEELSGVTWLPPRFAFPSPWVADASFFMSVVFDFDFDSEVTLTVFTVYFCGVMGVVPGLLNFAKKLIPERPVPLRKRAEGIDIWGGYSLVDVAA